MIVDGVVVDYVDGLYKGIINCFFYKFKVCFF